MAYTDKTSVEQYMGITIGSGLSDFVDELIAAATEFIEKFCGDEQFGPVSLQLLTPIPPVNESLTATAVPSFLSEISERSIP
jgi:hypothetical protein